MLRISCSGRSMPSAIKLAEYVNNETEEGAELVRWTQPKTDVNWGRYKANSTLNPDISNCTNKRVMRELFAEHGVPMPRLLDMTEVAERAVRGETVIGRPDRHTKGRGLWRIDSMVSLQKALKGTAIKDAMTHCMEYVEAPREYRVHVFLGKSIRISEKSFTDETKKEYTTAKPPKKINYIRQAGIQAVKALGLDFGTVDILADDENCWVLEVNASPGLGGTMPKVWGDTFIKWKNGEWEND